MARDFSGTAQYLTFADVAAHDWSAPWTVAAIVYTDNIAAGERHIVSHGDVGGTAGGWRFNTNAANLNFSAVAQWGQAGTATTALTTGEWYGVACTKASASTLVTYYRYLLSTSTFASETAETFANGYTDVANQGRIGAVNSGGAPIQVWDGRMRRVAMFGDDLSQAELEQFFRGTNTFSGVLKYWCEIRGLVDPELDYAASLAHATNTATTFVADPADVGDPFGATAIAGLGRRMQGWQQVLA